MKIMAKRIFSLMCFFSSLSLLSFVDFDGTNSASSENWRNGSHVRLFSPDFEYQRLPAVDQLFTTPQATNSNSFSRLSVDNNVLRIRLMDQKPTSIQIYNPDGKTQWYEFFAKKNYAIRTNLSKGVYIARLYQGEKYDTMTFRIE